MHLGWHALAVTTGKFPRQPQGQRVCKLGAAKGRVNLFGQLPVEGVTHHVVECRSLQHVRQQYPRVLAQASHELYEEKKPMLAIQPPQQLQQMLQCPRMTAYVGYCQKQQRRRKTGAWPKID
jgi:hypothetical protein